MTRTICLAAAIGVAQLVAGCSTDEGLIRVEGSGFFTPALMDYGVRAVGNVHELSTRLRNSSPNRLQVLDIRFEPPQEVYAAFLSGGGTLRGAQLDPSDAVDITLVFRPLAEGDYTSTLVVEAGDLEIPLQIQAVARQVAPARPGLSPATVRFFGSEVGRDVAQVVRVSNVGDTDGALEVVGAQAPFSVRAVGGGPLELPSPRLAPGDFIDVEVHFEPGSSGAHEGEVSFRFDTDEQVSLQVRGEAVAAAEITCAPLVVDFGELPRGHVGTASVSCTLTEGPYTLEAVRMASGSAPFFTLEPEQPTIVGRRLSFDVHFDGLGLVGRHDAIIEIVPAHRVVTRVSASATVLPPPAGEADLEVELVWNTGNSDFDLHLVRHDGRPFEVGKDCYFEDKHPDWGQPGYVGDDPILTTDDVNGFGPERVSLLYAAEPAYDLWVQFYGFESEIPPSTSVQITYQLRGEPERSLTQDLLECGVAWHVGRFTFDGGRGRFVAGGSLVMDFLPRASASCQP